MYIYIYIYINLPDMSQLPTSPFPKRGTSGPGNVLYIYTACFPGLQPETITVDTTLDITKTS